MKVCFAIAVVTLAGCSGPALMPELAQAEQAERAGDHERADLLYREAAARCHGIKQPRRRQMTCASAHLARAELLDRTGKKRQAAQAYAAIPKALPDDYPTAAEANYRAGRIHLDLGDDTQAYTLLWRAVTDYPEEAFAADALRVVVQDGRRRNAQQLFDVLLGLQEALRRTAVGDNIILALADLAENEFSDQKQALKFYDHLATDYEHSGLVDDGLWHGARLARTLGDGHGAVDRLRRLVARREVAFGAGSYFSVWLDNAQLELGLVLRDDLGELDKALKAFRALPDDYPDSILVDDALFESAATLAKLGRTEEACRVLERFATEFRDSKYEIEKAPALRTSAGCRNLPAPAD